MPKAGIRVDRLSTKAKGRGDTHSRSSPPSKAARGFYRPFGFLKDYSLPFIKPKENPLPSHALWRWAE